MRAFKDTRYKDMTGKCYSGENDIGVANEGLTSLEGSPKALDKSKDTSFNARENLFKNLIGAPQSLGGYFHCSNNPNLESLEGGPKDSGALFNCKNCPKLKNPKMQILKYRIKADEYNTDDGDFKFEDIKEEFELHDMNNRVSRPSMRKLLGLDK